MGYSSRITYDEEKFTELVIYVSDRCREHRRFGATKLNKILFYSDFIALRMLGAPVTGVQYQALERGPAPVRLLPVRRVLQRRDEIEIQRVGSQERVVPLREADVSLFSSDELKIVDEVIDALRDFTANEVSELSHTFLGWEAAIAEGPRTLIPYETAFVSNGELTEEEHTRVAEAFESYY